MLVPVTTNIFDLIQAEAAAPAPVAPVVVLDPLNPAFPFNGGRTEPTPGFVLPVAPKTKTLYDYQLAAVESILEHKRAILGYQPGMGKTAIMQASAAALVAQGARVIVCVPPALRISPWAEEFAADYSHLNVTLVEGQKQADIDPDADIVIVGESLLGHRLDDLQAVGASVLMFDEGHHYKSRTAKRAKAAQALADDPAVTTVVMATGTLATNNAADVYQPLRISGEDNARKVSRGSSYTRYMDEWCETELIWANGRNVKVVKGCKDAPGLRAKLLDTCYLSVPREDVLDLPERTFAIRSLMLNGEAREYRRMEQEFIQWVFDTKGKDAAIRATKAEAVTRLMALWEQDGKSKVKATVEYVKNMVDQGEQVVVMAWHTSVIEAIYMALRDHGIEVATISGASNSVSKAAKVAAFQAGDLQVVIGQITAAGTGLTLTASSNVVFAQLCWSPAVFGQASDRIYRIGQRNACTVHVLNGFEMVSEHLWNVLQAKAKVVDAINTGRESTIIEADIYTAVLESYGW